MNTLSPMRFSESTQREVELTETRRRLAEMRNLSTVARNDESRMKRPRSYTKQRVFLFENVLLDPDRSVLDEWPETSIDHVYSFKAENCANARHDVGHGFGVLPDSKKYRVRCIQGARIGEVLELDTVAYWMIAVESLTPRLTPRFEPVPMGTALRGPILPANFPSGGARQKAAKGLRKNADELTLKEIIAYWENRAKAQPEVYKL